MNTKLSSLKEYKSDIIHELKEMQESIKSAVIKLHHSREKEDRLFWIKVYTMRRQIYEATIDEQVTEIDKKIELFEDELRIAKELEDYNNVINDLLVSRQLKKQIEKLNKELETLRKLL